MKQLILNLRTYDGEPYVHANLIAQDGAARAGIMYGVLLPETAAFLEKALGLPVEKSHVPLENGDPEDVKRTAEKAEPQRTLFPQEAT